MDTLENTFTSTWNNQDNNALIDAWKDHAKVQLRCNLPYDGELRDTMLDGFFYAINGLNAMVVIHETTVLTEKGKTPEHQCSFSITIKDDAQKAEKKGKQAITGSARILKMMKDDRDNIQHVIIHFERSYTVRPLRSNIRYTWEKGFSRLFRIFIPLGLPTSQTELLQWLKDNDPKELSSEPYIINISAGGMCACLPRELAKTSYSPKVSYLVYFLSDLAEESAKPYIFLAKRLGTGGAECSGGIPIRMRFMAEVDWSSSDSLRWFDVREDGSPRLAEHLDENYSIMAKD